VTNLRLTVSSRFQEHSELKQLVMAIWSGVTPEKKAFAPTACLYPPTVVPRGLGVRDGRLKIKTGRQTAKASPVSGTKSLTVRCC